MDSQCGRSVKRAGYLSSQLRLGNLAGGAVFSLLLLQGRNAPAMRRVAVLIFSALMVPAILVERKPERPACIGLFRWQPLATRRSCQFAGHSRRMHFPGTLSRPFGALLAWAPESAPWCSHCYRLACGPVFFPSDIRSIRHSARGSLRGSFGSCRNSMRSGSQCSARKVRRSAWSCRHRSRCFLP